MKQLISFKKEIAFKTMIGEITSISLEHTLHFTSDSTVEGDLIVSGTYKMTEASTLEEPFNYALPVDIMLTSDLEEKDRSVAIDNFVYKIVNEEILEVEVDLLVKGLEKVEVQEEVMEVVDSLEGELLEEENEEVEEANVLEEVREVEEALVEEEPLTVLETLEEEQREEPLTGESEIASTQAFIDSLPNTLEVAELKDLKEVTPVTKEEVSIAMPVMKEVVENTKVETTLGVNETKDDPTDGTVMNSIFSAFANTEETYTTYSVYLLRENDNIEDVLSKYNITREELGYYNNLDDLHVGSKLIIPSTFQDA